MTHFIFFHGIAINTENVCTALIEPQQGDPEHAFIYISTRHDHVRHALPVDYETAKREWAEVWLQIVSRQNAVEFEAQRSTAISDATGKYMGNLLDAHGRLLQLIQQWQGKNAAFDAELEKARGAVANGLFKAGFTQ